MNPSPQIDRTIERLLQLPWTIVREVTVDGEALLRVKEIPSAVGSGDTDAERTADLRESLAASLSALIHFGDPVPVPEGHGEDLDHRRSRTRSA